MLRVFLCCLITFSLCFAIALNATDITSLLDLYNIRDNLNGSYTQTADIDLSSTDSSTLSAWSEQNYFAGDFVLYNSYTYICIQNTTSSQNPSDTIYWKQLWESSKGWLPLGDGSTAFTGTYDGNGWKITDLNINRPDTDLIGLFGRMTGTSSHIATLQNIKIETIDISGRSGVGSLLGKIDDNQYVVIMRCYAVSGSVTGFRTTGGLVGANNGYARGNPATARSKLFECFANISVSYHYFSDESRTPEKFGGLVGCNQRGETYDSYALGSVTGSDDTQNADRVGGLAGCVEQGLIVNCFSAGAVSGSGSNIGGLVGNITGAGTGGVSDSYWDTTTSGQSSSSAGTELTEAQMKSGTAFANWNTNFWSFSSGNYPGLSWNLAYTIDDSPTITASLIFQTTGHYTNSDIGSESHYLAFQSAENEVSETYLIFASYSRDSSLEELSGFDNPQNLGAYCRFWFQNQSGEDVNITSLNSSSYFYLQLDEQPQSIWFRFNDSNWQTVPAYTNVTDGEIPAYTYKIIISDLNLPSRAGTNALEFATDNGDTPLPITLSSFTAVFDGEVPFLQWVTASEINNAGWNIYRANTLDINLAMQVNPVLIEGQGTVTSTSSYEFYDFCSFGYDQFYYYWLESIDYTSNSELYGPIALFIPIIDDDNNNSPYTPLRFGLHDNYPNPFNPSTEISFTLDYNSLVSLDIYNLKGEKIITLLNDYPAQKANKHFTVWNGADAKGSLCSSGLYFYRLTTRKEIFIHKMTLTK